MPRLICIALVVASAFALVRTVQAHGPMQATTAASDGVIRPFNGANLEGWTGDLSCWSVENGELVGRTTAERPLPASTYLVWQGDMPQDFDLRCRVRISGKGANSGIQYRSSVVQGQADMHGMQADLDEANQYTGVLYEGLGRELMSARGEQVEWTPSGKRLLAQFAPDAALRKTIKTGEWNEYRIEARGTRLRHWMNGVLMSDVTDGDASRFRRDGQLAFQLHRGPPMEVRFADVEVRALVDAPPASALTVPPEFKVELLASAQGGQGSWVCMAFDALGRAIISPQSGPLLMAWLPGISRNPDGTPWKGTAADVRTLDAPVRSAQGLCVAHGALFVNVAQDGANNGLWRLRDADRNGSYEDAVRLVAYHGDGGEHGPHGVVLGPDGALYVAIGNHTLLPESVARSATEEQPGAAPGSPYDHFAEDLGGPRMWDPRGHAVGVRAPGGVVVRVDADTGAATIMAGGFRNAYDHCFNAEGELFTYDSDMEWDMGAPWYRAPRIVHVVRGGEYGWRSGSGCWPEWYADSLPPAAETDSASPTGMLSGHESGWPAPWRDMLFCADWTFGRVLAVSLTPDGATYRATWQGFIAGRPMPVTDMAWGADGEMYLLTGGRGTQSGLYRIRFSASHQPDAPEVAATVEQRAAMDAARVQAWARKACEAMMTPLGDAEYAEGEELLLASLESQDRWLRSAARTALEHQPPGRWRERTAASKVPLVQAEGALALARVGTEDDARSACAVAAALLGVPDVTAQRTAIRALQVAVARHPALRTDAAMAAAVRSSLAALDRSPEGPGAWGTLELACNIGVAEAVPAAMARLARAPDRATALRYATMLRTQREGWTDSLRAQYWAWLRAANDAAGGFSLGGFLEQIRRDAREHVGGEPEPSAAPSASAVSIAARSTGAPMHPWTVSELMQPAADDGERDLARGAQVFREATCILCHRFAGAGSSTGPDLTGVGARFSREDLLRAILEPSASVSDQYRDSVIETKDGSIVVGRIVGDSAEAIDVRTNPLGEERERVRKSDIVRTTPLESSAMPPGLLNARSRSEVLDLLAYLERGSAR